MKNDFITFFFVILYSAFSNQLFVSILPKTVWRLRTQETKMKLTWSTNFSLEEKHNCAELKNNKIVCKINLIFQQYTLILEETKKCKAEQRKNSWANSLMNHRYSSSIVSGPSYYPWRGLSYETEDAENAGEIERNGWHFNIQISRHSCVPRGTNLWPFFSALIRTSKLFI